VQLLLQHWPLPVQEAPVGRLQLPARCVPAGQQTSGLVQVTQVPPPLPQAWAVLPGWQMLPAQQPFGQLVAVHVQVPFWHWVPVGQLTQVTPPVPQACAVLPGLQVVPSQQPFGQLVALHTQLPLLHVVPEGQLTQAAPPVPQNWLVVPASQAVPLQQPVQVPGPHTLTQLPS
jgi:hypothetical protein